MPSINSLLLTSMALATGVFAQQYSCPGVLNANDAETACCVGGTIPPLTLSSCAGWPICTGPVTVTTTSKPISCATIIPVTVSDYSSLISSASASLAASGTNYQTTLANPGSAAATSAGAAASSAVSSASAMASSLESSASSAASSAGAAATSAAGGSGGSSAASDVKLQAGLIAAGLLVGAGAFLL